jgi:hypothetical protein
MVEGWVREYGGSVRASVNAWIDGLADGRLKTTLVWARDGLSASAGWATDARTRTEQAAASLRDKVAEALKGEQPASPAAQFMESARETLSNVWHQESDSPLDQRAKALELWLNRVEAALQLARLPFQAAGAAQVAPSPDVAQAAARLGTLRVQAQRGGSINSNELQNVTDGLIGIAQDRFGRLFSRQTIAGGAQRADGLLAETQQLIRDLQMIIELLRMAYSIARATGASEWVSEQAEALRASVATYQEQAPCSSGVKDCRMRSVRPPPVR